MNDQLKPTLILNPSRQAAPANGGALEVLVRLQASAVSVLTQLGQIRLGKRPDL